MVRRRTGIQHVGRAPLRRRTSQRDVPTLCRFMESRDLQNWMHIGTMNRSWLLALNQKLTPSSDPLHAIYGGEGRRGRWLVTEDVRTARSVLECSSPLELFPLYFNFLIAL